MPLKLLQAFSISITKLLLNFLEHYDDKVSPSITKVNLGEMAAKTCHTHREALWFLYSNEKFSDNVNTSGILSQHLEINKICIDNIETYCCYGYNQTNDHHFVACSIVAFLGIII